MARLRPVREGEFPEGEDARSRCLPQLEGTWKKLNDELRALVREKERREKEATAGILDSQSVTTTQEALVADGNADAGLEQDVFTCTWRQRPPPETPPGLGAAISVQTESLTR